MSSIYIFILVVLAILAILGIVVGVSNDAVNFLNSAIGSKVASFRKILLVASAGILVGVITSSGMMEVARSGVFHPGMFSFHEIMILFLGMMLGNVLLLDIFNSLGLPTSTTVSMVFGLLGSAMALAIFKDGPMGDYINSGKALAIISGILLSVVVAFVVGGIYMYLSRVLFSFRYHKLFSKIGWLWCGVSLAGILYFAMFKGLKSSGLISEWLINWVDGHLALALLIMWVGSAVLLLLLQLCRVDILKVTILAGTFSLALAFAGNDLVNFIGAPYAAFDAYNIAEASGGVVEKMTGLEGAAKANFLIMLGAGLVMILTLFFSKKTKKVIQTEQSLAGQDENSTGDYESNFISRAIVRGAVKMNNFYERVTPRRVQIAIEKRFKPLPVEERGDLVYDRIRATVNLTCASLLIAVGTAMKLPLSTTYVVFMVSMASALADRAWGRESAVYRVTGVMTVITGWFITALAGFAISMAVTMLLAWGGSIAIIILSLVCIYLVIKGNFFPKKDNKEEAKDDNKKSIDITDKSHNANEALIGYIENVCVDMESVTRIYGRTIVAVFKENRKVLRDMVKESNDLFFAAREQKYALLGMMKKLEQQDIATAPFYVQVVDYMSETTKALIHITRPAFDHIDNNHTGFTKEQIVDLKEVNDEVEEIFSSINTMLRSRDFSNMSSILEKRDRLFDKIDDIMKSQLRRMRTEHMSTSASILYFNILNETKTMVLQSRNIMKSLEHFVED